MANVLIIGAGITGCTAGLALARRGHTVTLVEAHSLVGGKVLDYGCKATDECTRCGVCVAHETLRDALADPRITIMTGATVTGVRWTGSKASVTVEQKLPAIDPRRCTHCNACVTACPANCVIRYQRGGVTHYAVDHARCRIHRGRSCQACAKACTAGAVTVGARSQTLTVRADSILVATGHRAFDATGKPTFGYRRLPGVLTGEEAEAKWADHATLGAEGQDVAFVQCIGSRDVSLGRPYCSSVCCAYATRLAQRLRHRDPSSRATVYFIDLQSFDKAFDRFRAGLTAAGVNLVRGVPVGVEPGTNGKLRLRIETAEGQHQTVEHDAVVLSVGMGPTSDASAVAAQFGLARNEDGFFAESRHPRVFSAGTCCSPQSIPDCMAAAQAAAVDIERALR